MPNRILKESICVSDDIDRLNWFEEVLFYRLIVACDDFGRYDGRPAIIKNRLFPLKESLTLKQVTSGLKTLASVGLVAMYEYDGKPFLHLPSWDDHQTRRASKSKYPDPADSTCKQMISGESECSASAHVFDNRIRNSYSGIESGNARPTVEDVRNYCQERKNSIDPQHFVDYYEQQGWKLSNGNPLKDWKAAIRNWERRDQDKKPRNYTGDHSRPDKRTITAMQQLLEEEAQYEEEGA